MKRANRIIESAYGSIEAAPPAVRAVIYYAAQSPRLEFGNYANSNHAESVRAYRSEAARITRQLRDVEKAARRAMFANVGDDDIVNASKHAYSGRMEVSRCASGGFDVDYCTGQYWPTEYRRAAECVLIEAARIANERAAHIAANQV